MNPRYECVLQDSIEMNGYRVRITRTIVLPFAPYNGMAFTLYESGDLLNERHHVCDVIWNHHRQVFLVELQRRRSWDESGTNANFDTFRELAKEAWSIDAWLSYKFDTKEQAEKAVAEDYDGVVDDGEIYPRLVGEKWCLLNPTELAFHEIQAAITPETAAKDTKAL